MTKLQKTENRMEERKYKVLANVTDGDKRAAEAAIVEGDLSKLTTVQRVQYVVAFCNSIGVNPLTRPVDLIKLNGKLQMYSTKNCTDQLRRIHGVSSRVLSRQVDKQAYSFDVEVEVTDVTGRRQTALGSVPIPVGRDGKINRVEACNAKMKAETKAFRRATLSLVGLSMLDESELDTIDLLKREGDGKAPFSYEGRVGLLGEGDLPKGGDRVRAALNLDKRDGKEEDDGGEARGEIQGEDSPEIIEVGETEGSWQD